MPVPSNPMTLTRHYNDPYRCELFSILMDLIIAYTLEQQYNCIFPPITVAVDIHAAIDMAILYNQDIEVVDQHHDILRSIRHLRSLISTPLKTQHVEGHKDRYTSYNDMTQDEQLNHQCDSVANYARTSLWPHPQVMPPLLLSSESTSVWIHGVKQYRHFNSSLLDHCCNDQVRRYYRR